MNHAVFTNVKGGGKDHFTAEVTIKDQITVHQEGSCGSKSEAADDLITKVTVKAYAPTVSTPQHDLWISDVTTP